jgi:hypothetical protein
MREMTPNHSSSLQQSDFQMPFHSGSRQPGKVLEGTAARGNLGPSHRAGLTGNQWSGLQHGNDLVFVSTDVADGEEKLQAIFSMNPSGTIRVQEISGSNPLQNVTEHLRSCPAGSLNRIWFLLGRDQRLWQQLAEGQQDHLVRNWQKAVAENGQLCFFEPLDPRLAAQLGQLSQIDVIDAGRFSHAVAFNEVIFVDERVAGYQNLVTELLKKHEAEVVLLPENQSGIQQIQQSMVGRKGIQAIHLIGPNKPGTLLLGTSVVNQQSIEGEFAEVFKQLKGCFVSDGEIRIYGGRFNQGAEGLASLKSISATTGVFVVVSRTGAESSPIDTSDESQKKKTQTEGTEWPAGFQTLMEAAHPRVVLPGGKLLDAWDVEMADAEEQVYNLRASSQVMLPSTFRRTTPPVQRGGTVVDLGWPLGWILVGLASGSLVTLLAQQFGLL